MRVFEIPEQNLDKLTERFGRMINRSRKCQTLAPTFAIIHENDEVIEPKEKGGMAHTQRYLYVVIEGERPQINGWQFVATIDHTNETGNIIRGVPGAGDIPVGFRKSAPHCQHCNHLRRRNETFVLRKEGEFKQVGRNCLADFFGGSIADYVVPLTELWESLGELAEEMEGWGDDYGGRIEMRFPVVSIINLTQEVIAEHGWLSKTKAIEQDRGAESTSSLVSSLLTPPQYRSTYAEMLWDTIKRNREERGEGGNLAIEQTTESALEWARSLNADDEQTSDYLYNLHTIAKGESVTYKGLGLLCSLIPAYVRMLEGERERGEKGESVPSVHIGEIGERTLFENVIVEWVGQPTYSQWGTTTPIKFKSGSNVLMLWSSTGADDFNLGETVSIVGTVKSHDNYKGIAQTVINRVKLWDGKPLKKTKKKS